MTNAIEQAKREMYERLAQLKKNADLLHLPEMWRMLERLETNLESYLELLRQDHEALHETARKRFEDLQVAEEANQELAKINQLFADQVAHVEKTNFDLYSRLGKMTEERDAIQLRLHAVDHAYSEQQSRPGTSGQTSGDRASCATPDAKTAAILGAVVDCQRIVTDWAMNGLKAKKAIRAISAVVNGSPRVLQALLQFERQGGTYGAWFINNDKCQHSFFAIGQDQMKCTFCGVGK